MFMGNLDLSLSKIEKTSPRLKFCDSPYYLSLTRSRDKSHGDRHQETRHTNNNGYQIRGFTLKNVLGLQRHLKDRVGVSLQWG